MGGDVTVASRPEGGSVFSFTVVCGPARGAPQFQDTRPMSEHTRVPLAGVRVHERQSSCMQQHAMDAEHAEVAVVAAVAMTGVADQVVRDMLEVAADLAEAAGLRLRAQQRVARGRVLGAGDLEFGGGQARGVPRTLLQQVRRTDRNHGPIGFAVG